MNDMFEGTFELKVHLNFDFLKDMLLQKQIEIEEEIINKFYACCFCQEVTSVPMWSYYADYHKGFCIEYSVNTFQDPVFPVVYTNKKYIVSPDDLTISYMQKSIMTKDLNWKAENEWRILQPNENATSIGIKINQPKPKGIYLGVDSDNNFGLENKLHEYCLENNVKLYKMKVDKKVRKLYAASIDL